MGRPTKRESAAQAALAEHAALRAILFKQIQEADAGGKRRQVIELTKEYRGLEKAQRADTAPKDSAKAEAKAERDRLKQELQVAKQIAKESQEKARLVEKQDAYIPFAYSRPPVKAAAHVSPTSEQATPDTSEPIAVPPSVQGPVDVLPTGGLGPPTH